MEKKINPTELEMKLVTVKNFKVEILSKLQKIACCIFKIIPSENIWSEIKVYPEDSINYYRMDDLLIVNNQGDKFLITEFGSDSVGNYFKAKSINYFIYPPNIDKTFSLYGNAFGECSINGRFANK